jgi:predicted  nucleic acid-binding Zn-ribbon protein
MTINYYSHCGEMWTDVCSEAMTDHCPKCYQTVEPYYTEKMEVD